MESDSTGLSSVSSQCTSTHYCCSTIQLLFHPSECHRAVRTPCYILSFTVMYRVLDEGCSISSHPTDGNDRKPVLSRCGHGV